MGAMGDSCQHRRTVVVGRPAKLRGAHVVAVEALGLRVHARDRPDGHL